MNSPLWCTHIVTSGNSYKPGGTQFIALMTQFKIEGGGLVQGVKN